MSKLTVETATFRFAGIMTLISVALTQWVHPNFFWFTVFIGANLLQFSFSGFCPAGMVFKMLGLRESAQCRIPDADDSKS